MTSNWYRLLWRSLLLPGVALALAELYFRTGFEQSDSLAPPSAVAVSLVQAAFDGSLLSATMDTLAAAASGLAIGFTTGAVLGTILGASRVVDHLLEVTIEFLRPVPAVALIPVAILLFGLGPKMEIAIVAYATVWPALIFARSAIQGAEPRLFEVARILQMGRLARFTKILIPAALPQLFVALRLSVAIALIVAVTIEIAANPIGVGNRMIEAQRALEPAGMLAMLAWIAILGSVLNAAVLRIQSGWFGRFNP